jgi:hypothetical protein
MKILLTVVVLLFALGARLEARDLPKPISAVEKQKVFSQTHSVRAPSQRVPGPVRLENTGQHREFHLTHGVRGR